MKLKLPVIIINFKSYKSATGANAVKLAKICEMVAMQKKVTIAVAVQAPDIYRVAESVKKGNSGERGVCRPNGR